MGLRFDPVGGGQFKQAVKQIIEAESQPIKQLQARKAVEESRLKLFQEFKTKFSAAEKALDEISNFKRLRELKADMGDGSNLVSVTVDKDKASPGSYQIEVDELAARSSVISNGFTDPDEPNLGIGFITCNLPNGDSAELFVDEDHASLRGIANLINKEANFPVRAAVIKDSKDADGPWKLILTSKSDGKEKGVEFPDFYFLDGETDLSIDDNHEAKNAVVQVDGFELQLDSNDVADFLPGVNLHLKQARPDQPFTLTITEDVQKVAGKVKNFVDKINEVLAFITKQNAIDKDSDTKSTFAGDTGLQTVEFRLRNMMHEGFGVGNPDSDGFKIYHLSDIGIEFDKTGQLAFKEDKFTKFMEKDFESLSQVITGDFGFAYQMKSLLGGYSRPGDGFLSLRDKGIRDRIRNIDDQIDQKNRALDRRQQSLTEQFARLEASLGDLQRQQQYLSATLPAGGGGNLVAQLLGG